MKMAEPFLFREWGEKDLKGAIEPLIQVSSACPP
jgi:hypothetical protein